MDHVDEPEGEVDTHAQSVNWIGTIHNYTDAHLQLFNDLAPELKFGCYGKEICPKTGRPHIHLCLYFKTNKRWTFLTKWFGDKHYFLPRRGSAYSAYAYATKGGDTVMIGTPPNEPKKRPAKDPHDWTAIKRAAIENRFDDIPDTVLLSKYSTLCRIRDENLKPPESVSATEFYILFGYSGTGKTVYIDEHWPVRYNKSSHDLWWDGYKGEEVVVYSEIDTMTPKLLLYSLKDIMDHGAVHVQVKYSHMYIRPRVVVVSTQYSPKELFPDPLLYDAIDRRAQFVYFLGARLPHQDDIIQDIPWSPDQEPSPFIKKI